MPPVRQMIDNVMLKTIIVVFVIAAAAVALMFAGLGLKMLFRKEKEFKRPCANAGRNHPATGRCAHCTCGRMNNENNV